MPFSGEPALRAKSEGMALIAVLWIVAALSIMISGVQTSVRSEIRIVGAGRQTLEAVALGEAAMHMALRQRVKLHQGRQLTRAGSLFVDAMRQVNAVYRKGLDRRSARR